MRYFELGLAKYEGLSAAEKMADEMLQDDGRDDRAIRDGDTVTHVAVDSALLGKKPTFLNQDLRKHITQDEGYEASNNISPTEKVARFVGGRLNYVHEGKGDFDIDDFIFKMRKVRERVLRFAPSMAKRVSGPGYSP